MLDKILKISAIAFFVVWALFAILLVVLGFSFLRQQQLAATQKSASQTLPVSTLTSTQKDCLKKTWGEATLNKYSNNLLQAPLDLRQKAVPCLTKK